MDQEYIENSLDLLKELIGSDYTDLKNHRLIWHPDYSKNYIGSVIFEIDYIHFIQEQKWHVTEPAYCVSICHDGNFKIVKIPLFPENLLFSADVLDELIKKWIQKIHPMNRQLIRTNVFRTELVSKVLDKDLLEQPEYMFELF
jgi:hypothetical protein